MTRFAPAVAVAVAVALGLSACGAEEFANSPRAPAPISVSTAITPAGITVSPSSFGAGTVELIASNLTSTSQSITLRSLRLPGDGQRLEQRTGPINPGDTASLKADLAEGTYHVSARSQTIAPARIKVGPPRPSAQDQLLQP